MQPFPIMDVKRGMRRWYFLFAALLVSAASAEPVEVHQVLVVSGSTGSGVVALTLDACDGGFNAGLIEFLIDNRIAATIFAPK